MWFQCFELCHLTEVISVGVNLQTVSYLQRSTSFGKTKIRFVLSVCYSLTKRDQCISRIDEVFIFIFIF